jgi:hypothetical protein
MHARQIESGNNNLAVSLYLGIQMEEATCGTISLTVVLGHVTLHECKLTLPKEAEWGWLYHEPSTASIFVATKECAPIPSTVQVLGITPVRYR